MAEKEKKCERMYNIVAGECLYDNCSLIGKVLHLWVSQGSTSLQPHLLVNLLGSLLSSSQFLHSHSWNWAFYIRSYNKEIKLKDLPQCPKADRSNKLTDQFEYYWKIEMQNAQERNKEPSLIWPMYKVFGGRILFNAIFCFIPQIALVFQAMMVSSFFGHFYYLVVNC